LILELVLEATVVDTKTALKVILFQWFDLVAGPISKSPRSASVGLGQNLPGHDAQP